MKNRKHILDCRPFHYVLSGLANDYALLLKTVMHLLDQHQPHAAWRLLDRADRLNPGLPIELDLMRAKALELCGHLPEALETAATACQLQPNRPEIAHYLLLLHAELLPEYPEQAIKLARATLHQENQWQKIVVALRILKQLQITPIGMCRYDGAVITGWLLDSPSLPALTVTIDGSDFKLSPYMATEFLNQQGFGSGHDGFSLKVPADQFKTIRIHLDGRDLAGSPIHSNKTLPQKVKPSDAFPKYSNLAAASHRNSKIDIIVPVYKGLEETKACLNAVLQAKNKIACRIIVVEDASPEPPLVDFLLDLHAKGFIELIRQPVNTGFVGAVNHGLRFSTHQDIVLLNADTCVHGDWLDRLHAVAYQSDNIGTVTPLSNNAELLSVPFPMQVSAMPEPAVLAKLDNASAQLGTASWVEIPVGVGFCLYIKRQCLNDVGFLDETLIERGYGEDTDLCLRATLHGWKNVCAPNVFVAHAGNVSFGADKKQLVLKNLPRIKERYPEHEEEYEDFLARQPLAPVYGHLQRAVLPAYAAKATKLILLPSILADRVTHEQIKALGNTAPQTVFYLAIEQTDKSDCKITLTSSNIYESIYLEYNWSTDDRQLWQDLHSACFNNIEIHSLSVWPLPIIEALIALNIPYQIILHDYSAYCLQNKLLKSTSPCISETADDATCAACISDHGCKNAFHTHPKALREFSARLFNGAEKVVLSSTDAMQRHAAYFPDISFDLDQSNISPAALVNTRETSFAENDGILRIAVFFAATPDQGFFKLLELSRLLASRRIDIELVIFGETWDDHALLASGKVWLAGSVEKEDLAHLIKLNGCTLAVHLALWPEVDGLAWHMARLSGLPLAAPLVGIYKELLDDTLGDIPLLPDKTVNEWLETILLARGAATLV